MKRIKLLSFILLITQSCLAAEIPTIAVSQIVAHPSLDAVRDGLLETLKESGFVDHKTMNWVYKNASGDIRTSVQIAHNLAALNPKPNVIVAIGTPTAQSAISATRQSPIPVIFAAVTDPVSSNLVKDLKQPHGLITGIIDFPPIDQQIAFMAEMIKELKTIGVLYNPAESNSVTVVDKFVKTAQQKGFKVIVVPITKAPDIGPAAKKLIDRKVDAIYVPQDNTIVAAMPSLAAIGREEKCPIFTSDNGSVKDGALAALSYSYYDIGRKAGEYVVSILKGVDIKLLPIATPNDPKIYINYQTLKALSLEIPDSILARHPEIYGQAKEKIDHSTGN
jgi:putative ABC transport system substrate-binding protein